MYDRYLQNFSSEFTVDESCGKCTPCRVGNKRLYEMLDKVTKGEGTMEDLDEMEALCHYIKENSLCGLGQTAPNPVLSTLRYFKDEYIAHVRDKNVRQAYARRWFRMRSIPLSALAAACASAAVR